MFYYRDYIIQTYENAGEPSSKKVRARPLPGQGVSTERKVECSEGMRLGHPVGTYFKVRCKITDKEGTQFMYRHYNWSYEVVSREQAEKFIKENFQ